MQPRNNNISKPFSMSTSATTGMPAATITGLAEGSGHGATEGFASVKNMSENTSHKDSLLLALDALFKEGKDAKFSAENPVLDIFPDLKDALVSVKEGFAWSALIGSIAPVSTIGQVSQLPLDLTSAIHGLLNSVENSDKFTRSDASTFDVNEANNKGFSGHCRALSNEFNNISNKLENNIDNQIKGGAFGATHAVMAKSTASIPGTLSLASAGVLSAGLDMIGSTLRDAGALTYFCDKESASEQEKNIYHALNVCIQSFSESKDSRESLKALKALEEAISNFKQASELSHKHTVTSPAITVFVRLLTSGTFLSTLRAVNSSALASIAANEELTRKRDDFSESTTQSAAKASSLAEVKVGDAAAPHTHSQNLTALSKKFDEIIAEINRNLALFINNDDDLSIIAKTASSTVGLSAAVTAVPVLITDFVGLISRELSGTLDFIKNDKGIERESKQTSATDKENTGVHLDALIIRASQLAERLERCHQLGVSAPVVMGVSHAVTCGALAVSLNSVAGMCFALSELRTLQDSPSAPLKLRPEEKVQAEKDKQSVINSNNLTAAKSGTQAVSANLTLHQQLQSVMEKIVLTRRTGDILNFEQPGAERNDLNSTAKSTIGFAENSTGFISGALGMLALASLQTGITSEVFFRLLRLATANSDNSRRLGRGVDKIKTGDNSQSNFSILSNATRLSAEKDASGTGTLLHTSHHLSEAIFSRSLTVALCQSGVLRQALLKLTREAKERNRHLIGFNDSAVTSVVIIDQLTGKIREVLDEVERGQGQEPMPGLNQDMASQIASISQTTLASSLSTHSAFIVSFLQSTAAASLASDIAPGHKNEAVLDSSISNAISTGLNIIQAFTKNCIGALQKIDGDVYRREDQNAFSLGSHLSLNHTTATSMVASCCLSLLCEEMLEMSLVSRSLTLLDEAKVELSSGVALNESQLRVKITSDAILDDSNSGQAQSITHASSALRLTLSHLGDSIADLAAKLNQQIDTAVETQRDGMNLHTSQRSMLKSLASSLSHCSITLSQVSGVLSMLPMVSAGTINEIRHFIHTRDVDLHFRQVQSSAGCSNSEESSRTTILFGISTDFVSDIILNITKMLLRTSLVGLDTSLSVAKILEICCLHPRPDQALTQEMVGSTQPNGSIKNLHSQTQRVSVATSVASAIVSDATQTQISIVDSESTQQCIRTIQRAVDREIEKCTILDDDVAEEEISLRLFYKILIQVIAQYAKCDRDSPDADYADLVNRFDRGGISLSNYHSDHGGIHSRLYAPEEKPKQNNLIKDDEFMGCDDAPTMLATFIIQAAKNEVKENQEGDTLLKKFKNKLTDDGNKHLSDKAQKIWTYIVNQTCDQVCDLHNRNRLLTFNHVQLKPFSRKNFINTMTIGEQPEQDQEHKQAPEEHVLLGISFEGVQEGRQSRHSLR
ncbi:MAG: hypothetical protein ABI597_06080 [Gammaproteobacteria bacterium]